MGQVIPFSEIDTYITSLEASGACKGTILDTNILISASYEMRDSHSEVVDLWAYLESKNYRLFATVSTRAEFLEFQRRLILTENLLDIIDAQSKVKLSSKAKAKIQTLKGSLMTSMVSDPEKDQVFNDSHLKKIKKEISAGPHSGQLNWLKLCEIYLTNQIALADKDLFDREVEYISPNDPTQAELFDKTLGWPEAIDICENSGTAFSDSMILNALKSSKLQFIVTLDFDIGYAALSDPKMKDVVVPDRLFKEFKQYHFQS